MKKTVIFSLFILLLASITVNAQFLSEKKNLQKQEGFFTFHYNKDAGELYLEVKKSFLETDFLYVHSLRTGVGSNDIGIDRGQLGDQAVVRFVKSGNTLLLMQPNQDYRASTDNVLEKRSVNEAFATSVLQGFDIKENTASYYVIDLTPFLKEDAHGIARTLKRNKQGTYKIDKNKSVLWMERTKTFPKNTEFEALLTFSGEPEGRNIRSVAPDASNVSVIQHHSFVALPDAGYMPREFDPRSGSFSISYLDYSTPIWEPIKKRLITRHRLEKKDPSAKISEAKAPIIYYLDPGTPEPVRTALMEGARWWNQAYEAIGYKDAFQVQLLPADADPMDVRYNVIQWVHRSTRGWSYGGSVIDPRTGEIIKGHVSLGSLRIRQDFMIAQALMDRPFADNDANYEPMLAMALARIRQLAAHEVGHTLGFAHNFAASANGRKSVMDYPHPTLRWDNNKVDFSNAYATGIGEWDKVTVGYSYSDVPANTSEKEHLNSILSKAQQAGLRYISDADARAQGGAHATAHLWDNGANAVEELEAVLELRKNAIKQFSIDNIRTGEPYSVLEDVFVPLYFYHRFQTEAAIKSIGGMDYNYALKGDGQKVVETLKASEQKEALKTVLQTLSVDHLMIPEDKLALFPPRAYGYNRSRESFKSNTGVSFDALGAASTASAMTLQLLLHPQRANRLVQQASIDKGQLSFKEVLETLEDFSFNTNKGNKYEKALRETVQFEIVQHIMNVIVSEQSIPQTKATATEALVAISRKLSSAGTDFEKYLLKEIARFEKDPTKFKVLPSPTIPDGSPIGSFECVIE